MYTTGPEIMPVAAGLAGLQQSGDEAILYLSYKFNVILAVRITGKTAVIQKVII
jgi:hypothetical protein